MKSKNSPRIYDGYQTGELLRVWEEIRSKDGTKAPREMIKAMSGFLREYHLALFDAAKNEGETKPAFKNRLPKTNRIIST